MKKLLITGSNSYIGNNLKDWLKQYPDKYIVETISLRDESWKNTDFSSYDTVLHLAGIAHVSSDPKQKELYYKVNRDLTIETAEKAKNEGVEQFIFMSSIIVYSNNAFENKVINKNTIPIPGDFYGNSKLQAEKGIKSLEEENFKVVIIRPPMIYGKESKGNYAKLQKAAKLLPLFPDFENQRSMLYIDNLCELIRLIIDNEERGIYFPQNKEFVKTSEMVKLIAEINKKNIMLTKIFNPLIKIIKKKSRILNKIFGNLVYEQDISEYKKDYRVHNLQSSIKATEIGVSRNDWHSKRKLDILLMSDNSLETVGGEQESTKIIAKGINQAFATGVIQPGEIKRPFHNIKYYPLTSKTRIKHLIKHPISFFIYIIKIQRIICTNQPSIIHTQAQISFFIIALLSKLKLIPENTKILHTERGLYTKYNKLIKGIFHSFTKELDVLITTTNFNMKHWKNALQNNNQALDFEIIENTAGELFETYEESFERLKSNILVIGFAGRYCNWKNWPLAMEICEKLNKELGENLYVKMAVGCLDKNAKEETENMFETMEKMLGSRFEGAINIDIAAMDKFYYDIDIFILTSNFNTESFGRTLVEAMSRKTVVLTTDAGGPVEIVNNRNRIFDKAGGFVEKVLELFDDQNSMEIEKELNLIKVKERYSLSSNINKHIHLYNKLIKND